MQRSFSINPQFSDVIYQKIKGHHIIARNYLRPFQIVLRTHKHDKSRIVRKALPQGLMIASKRCINDDAFIPIALEPRPDSLQRNEDPNVSQQHRRNLLNRLKEVNRNSDNPQRRLIKEINLSNSIQEINVNREPISQGFELAICVCVYSEDAKMLKQTLAGIKENVIDLVKSGVKQDAIGVFVFFDGIEKVDPSILEYIERMENQVINLNENNSFSAWEDYRKSQIGQRSERDFYQMPYQEAQNKFFRDHTSRILFNEKELLDRQERSFKRVYEEYMSTIKLKQEIQMLKKEKEISYSKLPSKVQETFKQLVKESYKSRFSLIEEVIYELMSQKKEAEKAFCMRALIETEAYCNKFMSTRSDLAYLCMHRELIYSKEHIDQEIANIIIEDEDNPNHRYRVIKHPHQGDEEAEALLEELKEIHLNLFFTVKYKNEGKLSSHNWFLNGFCKELNPNYIVMLDVGLRAKEKAIFSMYHHLKAHPKVGGVCGYMSLKIERTEEEEEVQTEEVDWLTNIAHTFVDIQRAQQVEYHFAHLLDKPFESLFDFIHVLPGAFSGYNMKAIHSPQDEEEAILRKYFESLNDKLTQNHIVESEMTLPWMAAKVLLPDVVASLFLTIDPESEEQMLCNENMNLAEDRILCFGIHKNGFDLAFLPDAYSEVDPIKTLDGLLGQRKRWINGSFFAFAKVKEDLTAFQESRGTWEFFLKLQMLYLSLVNGVSYFSVSLFLFTFHIAMRSFYSDNLSEIFEKALLTERVIPFFINTMDFIYVFFVLTIIYYSLNLSYNNKRFKTLLYLGSTALGIFSIVIFIVLLRDLFGIHDNKYFLQQKFIEVPKGIDTDTITKVLRYTIIAMMGLHVVPVVLYTFMHKKFQLFVEMGFGAISFLFYNPTYLIILNVYALCRMDDISWGTKGRNEEQHRHSKLKQKWRRIKFVHVFKYVFWNIVLSCILLSVEYEYYARLVVTLSIMAIITFILFVKLILGLAYSFIYKCKQREVPLATDPSSFVFLSDLTSHFRTNKLHEISNNTVSTNIQSLISDSVFVRLDETV